MLLTEETSQLGSISKVQASSDDPRDSHERWLEWGKVQLM